MLRNLRNLKRNSILKLYRYFPKAILGNIGFSYYLFRLTPLYSQKNKLVVFWNGKAGCSFITKWFFFQCDLLEEAINYNPWIHDYRNQVFTKKENYITNLSDALFDKSVTKIKLVRNPYARAVSAYFAVNTYFENNRKFDLFHKTERPKIFNFLKRKEDEGFSFNEFIDFLSHDESIDTHFIKQTHQLEKTKVFTFHKIIKLENIRDELSKLENELNLKSSSHLNFRNSSHNVTYSKESHSFCGNNVFEFHRSPDLVIPPFKSFYNSSIQKKVLQLYKEDFINYNYSKDLNY
jgi:hypothetical protein